MRTFLIAIILLGSTAAQALTDEQTKGLKIIGGNVALDKICGTHTLRRRQAIQERFGLDDSTLEKSKDIIEQATRRMIADIDDNPSSCAMSQQLDE